MAWGKSLLLTIPLVFSGIFVVASPASAKDFSDTNWRTVSAGGAHACATDTSSRLYCWGSDDHGELGNNTPLNSKTTPIQVNSWTGWSVVSAGGSHTCGIRSGRLYCWGSDESGQLGNGSGRKDQSAPQPVSSATDWVAVTAGTDHTCAIRSISGKGRMLACWGSDASGQIGNGSLPSPSTPAFVSKATDWVSVSAGDSHTCGLRSISGKGRMLACWGNDASGQIGNGSLPGPTRPAQVSSAYNWTSVSAGGSHTCGIRGTGILACWGSDQFGQIGNGGGVSLSGPASPAQVAKDLPANWKSVSAGGAHTCGIKGSTNVLYCWGDNQYGQTVAASDEALYTSPQRVSGSWRAQDTGQRHTCAIQGNGQLTCWGTPEPPPDCPNDVVENVYANEQWQDLGYWKLTTPVDGSDDNAFADEIRQTALKTFSNPDYFERLNSPTRIKFRAETNGATTSGSSFPRSELREMSQDGNYKVAAWNRNCGTHTMTITQAITAPPTRTNPKDPVVAGQIHDGKKLVPGTTNVFGHGDVAMIRLEGKRLFVEADGNARGDLDADYGLGQKFTVIITAKLNGITVQYTNLDEPVTATVGPFAPSVDNKQWYFKAGVYTQACYPQSDVCASNQVGTGAGEVVIYDLKVEHS